jgi:hypothetical protein
MIAARVSIRRASVRLRRDRHGKEVAVKYMMLINLGPAARDWKSLPEEDQKAIAAGWKLINDTPGVTPGAGLQPP